MSLPHPIKADEFAQSNHGFEKGALYKLETVQIEKYLASEGHTWVRLSPSGTAADARGTLQNAVQNISHAFIFNRDVSPDLWAAHEKIVEAPPSRFVVRGARSAAWLITAIEVVVIAFSVVFSGQTVIALVVGFVLAIAGYLSGLGLGTIMAGAFLRAERDSPADAGNVKVNGWTRFVTALAVALVMAAIRSEWGRDTGALAFTLGFTALIVTFTALGEFLRIRFDSDFLKYFRTEGAVAADLHRNAFNRVGAQGYDVLDSGSLAHDIDGNWIAAFSKGIVTWRRQQNRPNGPSEPAAMAS